MSSLFAVSARLVSLRRLLVKQPWIYWLVVVVAAGGAAASMHERSDRIDAERASWGDTRSVWVATSEHRPGDPVAAERRDVPAALVADGAAESVEGLAARQYVTEGEIVYTSDLVAPNAPQSLIPAGWLAVPVNESPVSGAMIGDRVRVVGDAVVLSTEGVVVGHHDGSSLIAVPAAEAPPIAALAARDGVTLLLIP